VLQGGAGHEEGEAARRPGVEETSAVAALWVSMAKRRRVDPTGEWQQLQLLAPWPEQVLYEALRPVVLFG
jgi:hypothetical protein